MSGTVYLGTQGWYYDSWIGPFYPPGTKTVEMLACYAKAFRSVEVDSTFYQIPADPVVVRWRESVPDGFVFALKLPQEITHERRLVDVAPTMDRFLSRVAPLGSHLGPILVQLSPAFRATGGHRRRFESFVRALPREYRWVVEFRDPAWLDQPTLDLLAEHRIALALVDGRWIRRERMLEACARPTAGFTYVRWMGGGRRFRDYSRIQATPAREFEEWGRALRKLRERTDAIFGYVNNHFQGHAPHSAREFQRLIGDTPVPPEALREQAELF